MKTYALLFTGIGQIQWGEVNVPDPGPGEIRIRTSLSGISPGTESRCLMGKQAGAPAWPFVPGYTTIGTIEDTGAQVRLAPGTRILCAGTARIEGANRLWGGHIAHALLPESQAIPLPEGLPCAQATLVRLAAIAYHGVRLTRPQPHEIAAVVGLGPIGQLSARLHALAGALVLGIDPVGARTDALAKTGIETAPDLEMAKARLERGADIVVDATGSPTVLPEALALARDLPWDDSLESGARILLQGSYPGDFVLPYATLFLKEATLLTPRDCQRRDQQTALQLLASGRLDLRGMEPRVRPPSEAAAVYAALQDPTSGWLTAAFDWSSVR